MESRDSNQYANGASQETQYKQHGTPNLAAIRNNRSSTDAMRNADHSRLQVDGGAPPRTGEFNGIAGERHRVAVIMVPADERDAGVFAHSVPLTTYPIAAALPPLQVPRSGRRFRARSPCSCRDKVLAHASAPRS